MYKVYQGDVDLSRTENVRLYYLPQPFGFARRIPSHVVLYARVAFKNCDGVRFDDIHSLIACSVEMCPVNSAMARRSPTEDVTNMGGFLSKADVGSFM